MPDAWRASLQVGMRYGTRATLIAAAIGVPVAAGVASSGAGSEARVGNVTCGQTLTESTTLDNDLDNCFADGLIAGADGITIDLNGHTISSRLGSTGGGVVVHGFDRVVVENGTITRFDAGVDVDFGADQTRVRDLRISDNAIGNGIEAGGLRTSVTGNTVFGREIGIRANGTTTTVAGNTVKDNETGMLLGGSGAVATRNTALSNAGFGIQVGDRTGAVTGNVANANGDDGIDATGATAATLDGNSASFNTGLGIDADGDVLDGGGNAATGNGSLHQCENVLCVEAR
jgi:parallel beta helix pectate lyase-like protein